MSETKRMTVEQVVGYLLECEGVEFSARIARVGVQELMEAEVSRAGWRRSR